MKNKIETNIKGFGIYPEGDLLRFSKYGINMETIYSFEGEKIIKELMLKNCKEIIEEMKRRINDLENSNQKKLEL